MYGYTFSAFDSSDAREYENFVKVWRECDKMEEMAKGSGNPPKHIKKKVREKNKRKKNISFSCPM